jgi:hypothetical protein
VVAQPDESLRTCKERPPRRPIKTDVDVALVIVDFGDYGDDCKSKHDATWKSIDEAKAIAERRNAEELKSKPDPKVEP